MGASRQGRESADTIRTLARVLSEVKTQDVSAAAIRQAQLLLLDTIGCGIAGAREEASRAVTAVALEQASVPVCALIGRPEKTGVLAAVLANGVAIRVLDLNDYLINEAHRQPETGGHPSDNIPVALAVGAARRRSGAEILAAIVVGYELHARLQLLMNRGGAWDGVTASGLVAPAIAGRLIGLDEERLAHALALGAARAPMPAIARSGDISSAKSIANALIAQSGVQAALLAERRLTGPLAILDDDARGLRALFSNGDFSQLTAPLAAAGAIMRAHVKAYPCINTGQSAVAAALELHPRLKGMIDDVDRIEISMADYPVIKRQQEDEGRTRPRSREAADHSFPFLVAVSLIDGAFGLAQYENRRWLEPRVTALMEKIVMRRDAAWITRAPGGFPCSLSVHCRDGREFAAETLYPPGFSRGGLDPERVIEKFHAVTAPFLHDPKRDRIVDAVTEFNHSRSTAALDAAISTEGVSR